MHNPPIGLEKAMDCQFCRCFIGDDHSMFLHRYDENRII